MKKISLLLLLTFLQIYSQQKSDIIYYSQNNTGFLHSFQDFAVDDNGRIIQVGGYYDVMNPGGISVFDGTHWISTKKGENNFAFATAYKVFYSKNNGTYYVYGSKLTSDIEGQKYFIQKFNELTNSWELIGDSVSFNYAAGLEDFYVTENGEIYATGSGGFRKLYPDSSVRIYPDNNPWFSPDYILPKPDGSMYLIDNWTDGWGGSHIALWNYTGSELDTIQTSLDSIYTTTDVALDDYGNIWLLDSYTNKKLIKYTNGSVTTYSIPVEGYAHALTMKRDGNFLWLGMYNNNDILLVKFNILSENWETFDLGKVPCFPYNTDIRKIVVQGDYLYLSNQNYLIKYDKNLNQVVTTWSEYNTGLPNTASGQDFTEMHIDKFGHYWINSLSAGVAMFNGDSWRTYSSCEINNSLVATSWALTTDSHGRVFTIGDSLRYLENSVWHSFYPSPNVAQILYGNSIAVDDNNSVWFADFYNGLGEFNIGDGSFIFYNSGLPSTRVSELMIASDGRIWLGFAENSYSCASVFDGNSFTNYSYVDGLTPKIASGICETPNGEIWFAFRNGLAKFVNEAWTSYTIEDYNIPLTEIKAIVSDNNGTIWFGGNSSVFLKIFSFDGNEITEHLISEDVWNNVADLVYDENGNIWIVTGSIVFVYNPSGDVIIGIKEDNSLHTKEFALYQNYPNPFNPTTKISFAIPKDMSNRHVTLRVYDALGRKVATLVNKRMGTGQYEVTFNGARLASGVYFYWLQAGDFVSTKKMILMK